MRKKQDKYEDKIKRLDDITEKLQAKGLELNESLKLYEEAISLYRECKIYLEDVEGKIRILEENI